MKPLRGVSDEVESYLKDVRRDDRTTTLDGEYVGQAGLSPRGRTADTAQLLPGYLDARGEPMCSPMISPETTSSTRRFC
jgi:hypothetical protein